MTHRPFTGLYNISLWILFCTIVWLRRNLVYFQTFCSVSWRNLLLLTLMLLLSIEIETIEFCFALDQIEILTRRVKTERIRTTWLPRNCINSSCTLIRELLVKIHFEIVWRLSKIGEASFCFKKSNIIFLQTRNCKSELTHSDLHLQSNYLSQKIKKVMMKSRMFTEYCAPRQIWRSVWNNFNCAPSRFQSHKIISLMN